MISDSDIIKWINTHGFIIFSILRATLAVPLIFFRSSSLSSRYLQNDVRIQYLYYYRLTTVPKFQYCVTIRQLLRTIDMNHQHLPQQSHFSVGRTERLGVGNGRNLSFEALELQAQLSLLLPLLDVIRIHVGQNGLLHEFLSQCL